MTKNVKITTDKMPQLLRALKRLTAEVVFVGIPAGDASRRPDAGEPVEINNAALAYVHEHGSPAANIPARPFLRAGVKSAAPKIVARYSAATKAALKGDVAALEAAHSDVGLIAQAAVRAKITDGPFEPLAPATLAKRKAARKGRKGAVREKPLIDTGQLRNAINYVVGPPMRPKR